MLFFCFVRLKRNLWIFHLLVWLFQCETCWICEGHAAPTTFTHLLLLLYEYNCNTIDMDVCSLASTKLYSWLFFAKCIYIFYLHTRTNVNMIQFCFVFFLRCIESIQVGLQRFLCAGLPDAVLFSYRCPPGVCTCLQSPCASCQDVEFPSISSKNPAFYWKINRRENP